MKTSSLISALLLTACTSASGALAAPATPAMQPVVVAPAANYFYEEGVRRALTPLDGLVALFGEAGAQGELVHSSGGASVVRATDAAALARLRAANARVSPVFREGNLPVGRLMALPGGVVVNFKPEWTAAQIATWLAQRSLAVQEKLALVGNWYVIKTEAGEASITTANAIQESGAVVSATPNWWKQSAAK